MQNQTAPKLSKWPFFAGDIVLLLVAYSTYYQSKVAIGPWQLSFACLCVTAGACFGILPFVLEYRSAEKLSEAGALTTVVAQIQNVEKVAAQIRSATGQWQTVQEQAHKTADLAKGIAERMATEAKAFTEFMQRANDSEKATLRLEVDKLRRAEKDWLQVLVRMLDPIYALHQGAVRSGQPNLAGQVGSFQDACRDAARRVGVTPFIAQESERFDAQRHQLVDEQIKAPPADAIIAETIATGYTFQGKLIRPALVRLRNGAEEEAMSAERGASTAAEQNQLPLEAAEKE
jgi:molecular chaperone GrpE (heat shock protein)